MPAKKTKNLIDLWYLIKKKLKLSFFEKQLLEFIGSKMTFI